MFIKIKKFFSQYLRKPWDFVASSFLVIKYWNKRKDALWTLSEFKKRVISVGDLVNQYENLGFKYIDETIDIVYPPWVTIARRGGDCDDFTVLAYEVLKDRYKVVLRGICEKKGGGHEFLVVLDNYNRYIMLSNTKIFGNYYDTLDQVGKATYGAHTKDYWFF